MISENRFEEIVGMRSLELGKVVDKDMLAFFSSLIEQNAKLIQKLQELDCLTKLPDDIVAEAHRKAGAIRLLAEKQARDRAVAIIGESLSKAKLEGDRILAEAKEKGQIIIEEETKSAQQYGLRIIEKAKEKAISILEDAKGQVAVFSQKARR